mmetsp:Transcript_151060/g.263243  ORF Transcript_151060/g.263243 Transcript_151060/m.263243 type:complete len:121 (+) Transcript_151060:50-412(+)
MPLPHAQSAALGNLLQMSGPVVYDFLITRLIIMIDARVGKFLLNSTRSGTCSINSKSQLLVLLLGLFLGLLAELVILPFQFVVPSWEPVLAELPSWLPMQPEPHLEVPLYRQCEASCLDR